MNMARKKKSPPVYSATVTVVEKTNHLGSLRRTLRALAETMS
jgi:hypothetical protein